MKTTDATPATDRGPERNGLAGLVVRLRERGTDCDWNGVYGGIQLGGW